MKYEIKVKKVNVDKVKAFVSLTFEDCFAVNNIKIIDGSKGLFIQMPTYKKKNNEYEDIAFPVTKEFREELYTAIMNEYNK